MRLANKLKSWRRLSVAWSGALCVGTETVLSFRYVIC